MGRPINWTPEIVPRGGINETISPTQLRDDEWTEAENAEPLPDGVRTRQGTSASNATAIQEIETFSEDGTEDREFIDGTSEFISQGFQVATTANVSVIAVRLKKVGVPPGGAAGGAVTAAIYDNNGGEPGSVVTGLNFWSTNFDNLNPTSANTEYYWHRFTSDTPTSLTASTQYHLVIRYTGASASGSGNDLYIETNTAGTYASGDVNTSTDGTTWVNAAAEDLNFRIYQGNATLTGIHDYRLSDASTQRHLVFADQEVYKNVSGTMTALSDRDRTGFTKDNDTFPSFAVGQDRCRIAHGTTDAVSKTFYVLSGTEYWENEGLSPPTANITLGTSATNPIADDTYQVDYAYWNDDLGIQSNSRYLGGSSAPSQATVSQSLTISGIPAAVAREGDRATHVRLFIKSSTQAIFRYVKQVTIGTTSATIDSTDTEEGTTEAEYNWNVPPQHTMKVVAENRQFIAGNSTSPWRLYYSKISGGVSYYESFPSLNTRDFGKGDNDYITALFFMAPRTLIVGCKNSIYALDARRPGTSDVEQIGKGVGISHHLAGRVVGRRLFFVSDGDESKGMFMWPGTGLVVPIPGIDDTFKELSQTRLKYASCAHLAPGDNRFQWWTAVAASGGATQNRILVYDYNLGAWTVYNHAMSNVVLGQFEDSSVNKIFIGSDDGVEYEADTGTDDAGTSITANVKMKWFDFSSQEIKKKTRFVDYVVAGKTAGSITLGLEGDFGSRPTKTFTIDHTSDAATIWDTGAVWDVNLKWAGASNITGRIGANTFAKYIRPTLNSANPFHLKTISFGVQATGRR